MNKAAGRIKCDVKNSKLICNKVYATKFIITGLYVSKFICNKFYNFQVHTKQNLYVTMFIITKFITSKHGNLFIKGLYIDTSN